MVSRTGKVLAAAVPLGMVASGVLVWQASYAAFSGSTSNSGNTFSAGTVSLTDNDSGTALFTASGLKPGSSDTKCIKVTYNGDIAANVKMYVKSGDLSNTTPGDLSPYLTFQVLEGTSTAADCSDFATTATDYNAAGSSGTTQTLSDFANTRTSFASGVGSFSAAPGDTKTYKITYWLQNDNNAQSKNASAKFTWEAQNT